MADRAANGKMPHLLIDRFRFDSFVPNLEEGSRRLLTRFGALVYMFFMITPPEMTVERAWTRGLKVGRYKAVEDILAQNVEAYSGMPELFFMWALIGSKRVHYEFLDNSVADGCPPRTAAFGWNGEMTILDIKCRSTSRGSGRSILERRQLLTFMPTWICRHKTTLTF